MFKKISKKFQNKRILILLIFLITIFSVFASDSLYIVIRRCNSEYFANLNTLANQTTALDARNETNTTVALITDLNASGNITICFLRENPVGTNGAALLTDLSKFIVIEVSSSIDNSLKNTLIHIYYNDSELITSSGTIDESTLRLYYWNTSTWQLVSSGVNISGNYVWANTTHFGQFGIFGTIFSTGTEIIISSLDNKGSSCILKWECTNWEPCRPDNTQTRICLNQGTCLDDYLTPATKQSCYYILPKEEKTISFQVTEKEKQESQVEEEPAEPSPIPLGFSVFAIVTLLTTVIIIYILKRKKKTQEEDQKENPFKKKKPEKQKKRIPKKKITTKGKRKK